VSTAVFFLHELVVARSSTEFRRQDLFKHLKKITVEVVHPFAGEFLVAPDVVKMELEPKPA